MFSPERANGKIARVSVFCSISSVYKRPDYWKSYSYLQDLGFFLFLYYHLAKLIKAKMWKPFLFQAISEEKSWFHINLVKFLIRPICYTLMWIYQYISVLMVCLVIWWFGILIKWFKDLGGLECQNSHYLVRKAELQNCNSPHTFPRRKCLSHSLLTSVYPWLTVPHFIHTFLKILISSQLYYLSFWSVSS